MKRAIFVILALLALSGPARGQGYDTSPGAQTGRLPFSSYGGGDIDSISLYNGNLMIDLPLLSLPGRELSTGIRAIYNSQKWQSFDFLGEAYNKYTGGWRMYDLIGDKPTVSAVLIECGDMDTGYWDVAVYWIDGLGTKRLFTRDEYAETQGCDHESNPAANLEFDSANGDRSILSTTASNPPSFIIQFANGVIIDFQGANPKVLTPTGNFLERDADGVAPYDTLNRTMGFNSTKLDPADPYDNTYTVKDGQGDNQDYKLTYKVSHDAYNPETLENTTIEDLLIGIELPNGKQYAFEYEAECDYGGLTGVKNSGYVSKIILPTGAYIRYTYACVGTRDYIIGRYVSEAGDGSDEKSWLYERTNESGNARDVTVTNPDQSKVVHKFNTEGLEVETQWLEPTVSEPMHKVTRSWDDDGVAGNSQPINPRVLTIVTIAGTKEQKTELSHDGIGRVIQTDVSDWYTTGQSAAALMRTTQDYLNLTDLPSTTEVKRWNGSSYDTVGKAQFFYDQGSLASVSGTVPQKTSGVSYRRYPTTIRRWLNSGAYQDETITYNEAGNAVTHTTPGGHTTTISYADNFTGQTSNYDSYAFPTSTSISTGLTTLTTSASYNYDTGLLVGSTDERGLTTLREYHDSLSRLTEVTHPGGDPLVETVSYDDTNRVVTTSAAISSGVAAQTETHFDKLYRVVKNIEKDPIGDVRADTIYDVNGRVWKVSQPYRSASPHNETAIYTTTIYDALNRPTEITNPDSSEVQIAYAENTVTITDEAQVPTRRTTNSLGHLTKVEQLNPAEQSPSLTNNPLVTTYTYDLNGGLTGVNQYSALTRSFTRNWLGQLLSETHPESGTTAYTYDDDGNVETRTRVHPAPPSPDIVATYTYDNIGRMTEVSYSDSTPTVTRTYDEGSSPSFKGLLTSMSDGAGSVSYTYKTNANLLASETRTFTGVTGSFTTTYEYDKAGRLTTVVYPSGRHVTHTYATGSGFTVGREDTLAAKPDAMGSSTTLANNVSVTSSGSGRTVSRTLGNGVVETTGFNLRSQLTNIGATLSSASLVDLTYGYGSANTGRILSRTDDVQPEHSVNYTYDALYRLKQASAANSSWGISWVLDGYGNRTSQTPSGLATSRVGSPSIAYTNNQNNAWTHDVWGNVTNDSVSTYAYNAENQMTSMGGGTVTYAYDGDGRRVAKTAGGVTTFYLYGLTGLMSEFSTASGVAEAADTDRLEYRIAEQTGTPVLLMASSGLVVENNRALPYGELWQPAFGSTNKENFTTYQRDSETVFDYAMARYYASREGRFISPDPGHFGARVGDPQSWNAYAYSRNDPINLVDPTGLMYSFCVTVGAAGCYDAYDRDFESIIGDQGYSLVGGLGLGDRGWILRNGTRVGDYFHYSLDDPGGIGGGGGGGGGDNGGGGGGGAPTVTVTSGPTRPVTPPQACSTSGDALTFAAGVFDSLSFGLAPAIRGLLWDSDPVNPRDTTYQGGYTTGTVASLTVGTARAAYAGSAKAVSVFARSGEAASNLRNVSKVAFRLGASRARTYSYAELLAKYGSDEAVQAAAGRTSPFWNGVGAATLANGAHGFFTSYDCR